MSFWRFRLTLAVSRTVHELTQSVSYTRDDAHDTAKEHHVTVVANVLSPFRYPNMTRPACAKATDLRILLEATLAASTTSRYSRQL